MINWVTQLSIKEKVKLFNKLYDELAGYGREGDTELAHINPFEAELLKAVGGSGTINPVTGLREYKGGSKAPPPPPATQTVRQEATIPDELKPFVTDILEESQAQFRQRQEEGYVPYEGAQIAQFTPEQEQAFQATRGIFEQGLAGTPLGQSTTYLAPALGATTASTLPTTADTIGQYMDPYLENVLRVQEQEARRADEISRQGRAAQAVQAGAFGGSREAVMEAEAQRGLEDRLASLRATGMSQAYQTAQQMAEAQRARELQAGRQFAALGETAAQQQAREIGGLAATGEALRGQRQAGLDIAKTQFMEEQQFPQSQLQQYSSIIRGFPLTPNQLQTTQKVTPQPSLTQQLLGAGIGAAGLAGAFGAFKKEGGLVGLAEGGRPMDAMPMAAMPMKPRRRAADLGAAIGDLAQRMGTGRSLSQTGSGLTSILSAPAISENMQQMPQPSAMPMQQMQNMQQMPQASASPMQMPSQRFMNAGGKVGYYQQGDMIPFSQKLVAPSPLTAIPGIATPPSGGVFPEGGKVSLDELIKARTEAEQAEFQSAEQKRRAAEMVYEGVPETERLRNKLIDQEKAIKGLKDTAKEESEKDKDLIASEKWATLINIGAAIASPEGGTQGILPDLTKAVSSQVGEFKDIARRERQVARDLRKELLDIDDKELNILAKQQGISKDQLNARTQALITDAEIKGDLAKSREDSLDKVNALKIQIATLQGEAADRAAEKLKAAAKTAEENAIKGADYDRIKKAAGQAAYPGPFTVDAAGNPKYLGDQNDLGNPAYKMKEDEMKLAVVEAYDYAKKNKINGEEIDPFVFSQRIIEELRQIPIEEIQPGQAPTRGRYSLQEALKRLKAVDDDPLNVR